MMLVLFSPVPASLAPAFWTKKTSFPAGYLQSMNKSDVSHRGPVAKTWSAYQTTASWNKGSFSLDAIRVRVAFDPRRSRNASLYTWNGLSVASCVVIPGGTNTCFVFELRQLHSLLLLCTEPSRLTYTAQILHRRRVYSLKHSKRLLINALCVFRQT